MQKSDGIKIVVIVVALVGAAALIAWNFGLFSGGGSTVSGGDVVTSDGERQAPADPEVKEGERKVISDGFTPKNAF
ncbi:MAG: hypothetical protein KDA21_03975 [Phycisphaerales bacterium]|nr:hypothetical protein [Phycisphaerales bacterium]